jgi:GNAT superfamily N-acetyltransferase
MERIRYRSPKESMEEGDDPQHTFDLIVNGEKIGSAEINYLSKPLPLYQLTDLYVDFEHRGKGYASKLMDQVECWLKERKKPGVLVEAILEGDPALGMYAKRGWVPVPDSFGLHVYNWPRGVDLSILKGYPLRYTQAMDREGWSGSIDDSQE